MLSEGILIALSGSGSALLVALVNILPQLRTRRDIKELLDYVKNDKNVEEIRQKFINIQSYYVNKIHPSIKTAAIMKSDNFIKLVIDFGLGLDLDDINDYQSFQDHLFAASKYNEIKMSQDIGSELTKKYYDRHKTNVLRYNSIIQKIFFTTENSKKTKFVSASIDFMQLFMTELYCLVNGKEKQDLLDECAQKMRRCEDHSDLKSCQVWPEIK